MEASSFEGLRIAIASPDKIHEWSRGEVKKAETINYRMDFSVKRSSVLQRIMNVLVVNTRD